MQLESKLEIESGIPIPDQLGCKGHTAIARKMKPGDSIFFQSEREARIFYRTLSRTVKGTKFNRLMRKVEGGYRVWKLLTRSNEYKRWRKSHAPRG